MDLPTLSRGREQILSGSTLHQRRHYSPHRCMGWARHEIYPACRRSTLQSPRTVLAPLRRMFCMEEGTEFCLSNSRWSHRSQPDPRLEAVQCMSISPYQPTYQAHKERGHCKRAAGSLRGCREHRVNAGVLMACQQDAPRNQWNGCPLPQLQSSRACKSNWAAASAEDNMLDRVVAQAAVRTARWR